MTQFHIYVDVEVTRGCANTEGCIFLKRTGYFKITWKRFLVKVFFDLSYREK